MAGAGVAQGASVNLAGQWMLSAPGQATQSITLPGRTPHNVGPRFDLECMFPASPDMENQPNALLIGTAATFLEIEINGTRLTNTLDAQKTFVEYPENAARLYLIPPGLLRSTEQNHLIVRVIRTYGGPGGILAGPILIGPFESLHLLAERMKVPILLLEVGMLATVTFGLMLVLLLAVRTGGNAMLAVFMVFSVLTLVSLVSESLLLYSQGWKSGLVVRLGWTAFGLVAPSLLWFLVILFGLRVSWLNRIVISGSAVIALLILVLPDPSLMALPFMIFSAGAFILSVPVLFRARREGRREVLPLAAGLCGFLFFSLWSMAELVGAIQLSFPPVPQKTILLLQLALLTLYFLVLLALCESFLASQKAMRKLADDVLLARDRERERIGRDLHDRLGQTLQAALLLSQGSNAMRPSQSPDRLQAALHEALAEIREISKDLHPRILSSLSLGEAIESYLEERRSDVSFEIIHQIDFKGKLEDSISSQLFSVFLEAFHNAIRHSKASRVDIRLFQTHRSIVFELADNGIAHKNNSSTMGLGRQTMRERMNMIGGYVDWYARREGGLVVHAEMPLPREFE